MMAMAHDGEAASSPQSVAQLTRWWQQTVMYLKTLTLEMELPATRTNTDSQRPGGAAAAAAAAARYKASSSVMQLSDIPAKQVHQEKKTKNRTKQTMLWWATDQWERDEWSKKGFRPFFFFCLFVFL